MRRLLFLLPLFAACATTTLKMGRFEVSKEDWDNARERVTSRAAFEINCPAEKLSLTLLATYGREGNGYPTQIGVDGCERRVVYVNVNGQWVLNSTGESGR